MTKEDIRQVIEGLQHACCQSLFNGIAGSSDNFVGRSTVSRNKLDGLASSRGSASKRRRREGNKPSTKDESWDAILARANTLLNSMTSHEHGEVSRLVGILLLGFFLPQSTGNSFFSSQNLSSRQRLHQKLESQSSGIQTAENQINFQNLIEHNISMSLEDRLESNAHRYGNEFGELDDLIVQEHLESALQSFLKNGLKPFLLGRPAHDTQVDLIHVMAMAIHPCPSERCIRQTKSRLEEQKSDIWCMTTRLMSSLVANSFNVNYHHRVELVQIVLNCLIIPECQHEAGICQNAPLFEGAIPHLRASLYAFGMASLSPRHSHLAQCAMVSLAIQGRIDHVAKEEWSRLLHRLVDDRTNYNNDFLNDSNKQTTNRTTALVTINSQSQTDDFCPHTSRGFLLRDFLIRFSEARRFADEDFLQYALSSLTDAIEMQVDCWTKAKEEEETTEMTTSSNHPPLVLASLLDAAKNLFHFLLPMKGTGKENEEDFDGTDESEDSHSRDMLISCGIQLVHHWVPAIVKEACSMLVLAFSYTEDMWEDYVGAVYDSIVIAIDIAMKSNNGEGKSVVPIEGLVSAFSQRSLTFAVNLFRFLLQKSPDTNPPIKFRLIAAIANARPAVAETQSALLIEHLQKVEDPHAKKHILASILSCRKTHYFANKEDALTNLRPMILISSLGTWDKYLISRHAIMTGNFDVAKELYNELMNLSSSDINFVWLSAMEKIADGEGRLCNDGMKAIPETTSKLLIAIGELRSLQALNEVSTSFQIKLLKLRVCFLDLLTNIRRLTVEMRLTGAEPKKFTRPNLHLRNVVKLLSNLSIDYMRLYEQYGLFLCQQSRSVLRTLHVLCSFVARAAKQVFLDSIIIDERKDQKVLVRGDITQPLTSLLKQVDSFALEKLNQFVDAKIRAVTLLEIMDCVLKTPFPIPRALTSPKTLPCASLRVFCDPDTYDSEDNRMEICRGNPAVCLASGTIPQSLISRSQIPFTTIILWYRLDSKSGSMQSKKNECGQISAPMSPSGAFFTKVTSRELLHEGWYDLKFRLGCRDVRGGEWELPLNEDSHYVTIEVLRATTA